MLTSPQARAAFRRLGAWELALMPALVRCLCREMIDDVDEAYLTGALADPTCKAHHIGADANRIITYDDADLVVLPESWDVPATGVSLALVMLPYTLAQWIEALGTFGEPEWRDEYWDCGPEQAWDRLEEPVRRALERSASHAIWYDKGTEQWATVGIVDLFFSDRDRFFAANDADRRVRVYPSIGSGE